MIGTAILNRLADRLFAALAPVDVPLRPLVVDGVDAGYLDDARAASLARFPGVFDVTAHAIRFVGTLDTPAARTRALEAVARTLAADGMLTRWRDERYAVAASPSHPALFEIERAAARFFGIATLAAHVNGIVEGARSPRMWIARRSGTKPIDPGMLDNLVGGGVAAGTSVAATVVKEAWEEAGIPAALSAHARAAGSVGILRMQPDGLHRETIHVHDLELPSAFAPVNQDGEVAGYRLVDVDTLVTVLGNAEGPDVMTADASLVAVDWLLRRGFVARDDPAVTRLRALCRPAPMRVAPR